MADRLAQFVRIYIGSEKNKWIQDVANRWWSPCSIVGSLLELKRAINKPEEDNLELTLVTVDWAARAVILTIPEPFMHTRTLLEGAKFVTASLVVPFICKIRNSLDAAIELRGGVA